MNRLAQPGLSPAWIVVAAGVSASLHVGKLPPAVGMLQEQLGVSLVQAGFLLSTVQVAGMVLGLAVGLMADRWGLRRTLLIGLLLMAAASAMGAAATGFVWLLMTRVLEGLGFLLTVMPGPGLIRRSVPAHELSARMGWWGSYMPLGSATALMLGPWVLRAAGWQFWWLLLGVTSLLAALAVWRWVPADEAHVANADAASLATEQHAWHARLLQTVRSSGPWLVAVSFAVYSCQWIGLVGFLPTIYAQAGLSAQMAGLLTALMAAANVLGNVASGRLLQSGWSPKRSLQTGFVIMGLCGVLAFVQWNGESLLPLAGRFLAVVCFSAVGGLIPGTLFTAAVHLAPNTNTVSTTVGFMQQLSCVGQFAGPPMLAALASWAGGWQFSWAMMLALCAVGWLLAVVVGQRWQASQR